MIYKVFFFLLKLRRHLCKVPIVSHEWSMLLLYLFFIHTISILEDLLKLSSFFPRSEASSSINTSGDVLTFTDLSGVFYCVLFGMISSLLVLLVELLIEAHKDTKRNNKEVV